MRAAAACLALAACTSGAGRPAIYAPPPGINEVLTGPIESAPGHSLVMGDLALPAGAAIPRHYHYGEEFIYVLGGSAVVSRAGQADVTLHPGDGLRIAPGVVHWGRSGPDGFRGISTWVKADDKPLREPVAE